MRITIHDDATIELENTNPDSVTLNSRNIHSVCSCNGDPIYPYGDDFDFLPDVESLVLADADKVTFMFTVKSYILPGELLDISFIRHQDSGAWSGRIFTCDNAFSFSLSKEFSARADKAYLKFQKYTNPVPPVPPVPPKTEVICPGNTVKLKSGGPLMTVLNVKDDMALVMWFPTGSSDSSYVRTPVSGLLLSSLVLRG